MSPSFLHCLVAVALLLGSATATPARPNVLWISIEDTSPWLGFCGDRQAVTPHLDALARESIRYRNAFSTAPVCAPSRFAIITGRYATSFGTQRLRSAFPIPATITGFPAALRQAGYYTCNRVKTDYNTSAEPRLIAESWDDSSATASWRNRAPDQPFFAVINLMETHQSRIFETAAPPLLTHSQPRDPERTEVPPYFPNTPTARRTLARVHDAITAMDERVGQILAELAADGLAEDTVVFFWADHGQGIPRGKRTLWDTGLQVPLLVFFPPPLRTLAPAPPGTVSDRFVSLMDLGPSVLNLLGLPVPEGIHGQPFLGLEAANPRTLIFGARDRVDEAEELSRSVRDERFLYIRNFFPDLSWAQPETYSDQLALRREITALAQAGKLDAAQMSYTAPRKPVEELYDRSADPWQLHNLAADPAFRTDLERLRQKLRDWQVETQDLGMIHESHTAQLCEETGLPLIEAVRAPDRFHLERVLDTAWRVGDPGEISTFTERLTDPDPTVRYWSAIGLRVAGQEAIAAKEALRVALADASSSVRIEAAGWLVRWADDPDAMNVLADSLKTGSEATQLHAARTLQLLGEQARPALPALQAALPKVQNMFTRWSLQGAIALLTGTENEALRELAEPKPR
jgi:N-sulfoglucosamine sulfohydrolase